ncbi:hypothetical protein VU06_02780 [Desulfobulbus sp. F3]|nr:hypothetical protein [Desulfobulbus sp. F3]
MQCPAQDSRYWMWICGLSSHGLFLTLVTLAIHIRLGLGRWPVYGEEYHTVLFRTHEVFLYGAALVAFLVAAPLWLLLCFRSFRVSWRTRLVQAMVFISGWLLISLSGKYDPTSFTDWFLD